MCVNCAARQSVSSPAPLPPPASSSATAAADSTRHQQPGLECLVDEVKTEIQREMDRLDKRMDKIDKQVSTILQLLTASRTPEPAAGQQLGGVSADNTLTDRKIPRTVHSPSFMHTITEQEEDVNSVETIDDTVDTGKQWKMSKTEQLNSGGQAAQWVLNDLEII